LLPRPRLPTNTPAGACKILFQLQIIYFILAKYAVACTITAVAQESITAVAWDSAGGRVLWERVAAAGCCSTPQEHVWCDGRAVCAPPRARA
jgi:hypothetical protein